MTVTQNFLISTSWKRKILNLDTKANTIHNSFCWINIGTVTSRILQRRLLALSRKLKKTILFLLVSRLKHWHDTPSHASQCTTFPPPYLPTHPNRLLTTIMFQAFLTSLYSTFCAKELECPLPCSHKPHWILSWATRIHLSSGVVDCPLLFFQTKHHLTTKSGILLRWACW